jgi:hypothetical protein|tara:strand:+ start:821 stop:1153 length:333 start_codon:yes stop_codon:yes gene_type:complete
VYSAIKLKANGSQEIIERPHNPSMEDYRKLLGVENIDQYPCVYKNKEKRLVASIGDKSLFINDQATDLYKKWLTTKNESPMPYANTLFIRGDAILVLQVANVTGGIDDQR